MESKLHLVSKKVRRVQRIQNEQSFLKPSLKAFQMALIKLNWFGHPKNRWRSRDLLIGIDRAPICHLTPTNGSYVGFPIENR